MGIVVQMEFLGSQSDCALDSWREVPFAPGKAKEFGTRGH